MATALTEAGFFQNRQKVWDHYLLPLQKVEDRLKKTLISQSNLIAHIGKHILIGGKRIRPLLAIIAANLNGERNFGEEVILIACAVELIHTTSLLHDDVIDDAVKRRNKDSARIIWGNKASILVGDHLYAQGVSIMESLRDHEMNDVFLEACRLMTEGETLQLSNLRNLNLTEKIYFRIIRYKTAALVSATCRLSAIAAKMETEKQETLAQFGLKLGLAFQIVDDTLDYIGNGQIMGKSIRKDLRNGEMSLPFLHLLSSCGKKEREKFQEAFRTSILSPSVFREILGLMKKYGSIEYSMNKARESVESAKDSLSLYPNSIHRQALLHLADYVIYRDH